jgi:hypothetical protein
MDKCLVITVGCIFLFLVIPIGIASITISQVESNQCDYRDIMGLDIKQYLLGAGIASIGFNLLLVIFLVISWMSMTSSRYEIFSICTTVTFVTNVLFGIAWTIIGGVILFRSNMACIEQGVPLVCYALIVFIIAFASFSTFIRLSIIEI